MEPTPEFLRDVDALADELGDAAATSVIEALGRALEKLDTYDWAGGLPIQPHGRYGDTYCYLFHKDFALIFRRATERDAEKKPLLTRLFLKNLLRR